MRDLKGIPARRQAGEHANAKSEAEARNPGFEGGTKVTGEKKSLPLR